MKVKHLSPSKAKSEVLILEHKVPLHRKNKTYHALKNQIIAKIRCYACLDILSAFNINFAKVIQDIMSQRI